MLATLETNNNDYKLININKYDNERHKPRLLKALESNLVHNDQYLENLRQNNTSCCTLV